MSQRVLYVVLLPLLRAAAQQDHQRRAVPAEIDTIAGSAIDPQFCGTFADRLHIRAIAVAKSREPRCDKRRCLAVERIEPFAERALILFGQILFNTDYMVPFMLPIGNSILVILWKAEGEKTEIGHR